MKIRKIAPAGEGALVVMFEEKIDQMTNQKVQFLYRKLRKLKIKGLKEGIPSYCSLLLFYDPMVISYNKLRFIITRIREEKQSMELSENKIVEIPVCYGGSFGEDLETVATYSGLSQEEVVTIHTQTCYPVYMVGFLPGFPYLGGLDSRIHTPRLANPRIEIPAGSVGIGGEQTGVYPLASPGGWQLIGRTPLKLYDSSLADPVMLRAGDSVRFVKITPNEYEEIANQMKRESDSGKALLGGVL